MWSCFVDWCLLRVVCYVFVVLLAGVSQLPVVFLLLDCCLQVMNCFLLSDDAAIFLFVAVRCLL